MDTVADTPVMVPPGVLGRDRATDSEVAEHSHSNRVAEPPRLLPPRLWDHPMDNDKVVQLPSCHRTGHFRSPLHRDKVPSLASDKVVHQYYGAIGSPTTLFFLTFAPPSSLKLLGGFS